MATMEMTGFDDVVVMKKRQEKGLEADKVASIGLRSAECDQVTIPVIALSIRPGPSTTVYVCT